MSSPQRVLHVGATGTLGKMVLRKMIEKGLDVTALVRHPEKIDEDLIKASNLHIVKGEVTDGAIAAEVMKNKDIVVR